MSDRAKPEAPKELTRNGMPLYTRTSQLRSKTWNPETRTVEVSLGTGIEVLRYDWRKDELFYERLSMDPAHIRMQRMQAGMPFLEDHNSYTARATVGKFVPGETRIENGEIVGPVRLSKAKRHEDTTGDIADGILTETSVGYLIHAWDDPKVREKKDGIEVRTAVDWEPYEGSIVGVKADITAGVRSGNDEEEHMKTAEQLKAEREAKEAEERAAAEAERKRKEEEAAQEAERKRLEEEERAKGGGGGTADDPVQMALAAERERVAEIEEFGGRLGAKPAVIREFVKKGTSVLDAQRAMYNAWAADDIARRTDGNHGVEVTGDEGDKLLRGLGDSLSARALGEEVPDSAKAYRGKTMVGAGEEFLKLRGQYDTGMYPAEVAARALSSGDFQKVLAGVINKVMMKGYKPAALTFPKWAVRNDFTTLHERKFVKVSEGSALLDVEPGEEYEESILKDGGEGYSLFKSGRILVLTLETFLLDDMRQFTSPAKRFGNSALRKQEAFMYSRLYVQRMADGQLVFHSSRGNIATKVGVPNAERLDEMDQILMLREGMLAEEDKADGQAPELVGAPMAFLIGPRKLKLGTEQMFGDRYKATTPEDTITEDQAGLTRIWTPYLDRFDADAYFGCVSPDDGDTAEYGYLAGEGGPVVIPEQGWKDDTLKWKCRLFFGGALPEPGCWVKNPGK